MRSSEADSSTGRPASTGIGSDASFRVRVSLGVDAGRQAVSTGGRLVVGTADGVDLKLTDRAVSERHLELVATEGGVLVRGNGVTTLGGHVVREILACEPVELGLGQSRLQLTFDDLAPRSGTSSPARLGRLVGESETMRATFELLERTAPTSAPVLLIGESGTGKEVAARAIHALSPRRAAPFEVVDCAGLSPALIESQLFGHETAAGAPEGVAGVFEQAHLGTLFLDGVEELPLELQPKLARALGERAFRRLGAHHTRSVDVRIVAATTRDLQREVSAGRLRPELYYRLAVVQIRIPPLRERLGDLPALISDLVNDISFGARIPEQLDYALLRRHPWPGNVRELRNYLEQMLVLQSSAAPDAFAESGEFAVDRFETLPLHAALERFERDYTLRLLEATGGNVAKAARRAGVNRATMFRIIGKHGLKKSRSPRAE